MDVFIKGEKVVFEIENEKTVGEILGSIETACEKAGMTITGISADGKNIPADKLDGFFAQLYTDFARIDLDTISGLDVMAKMRVLGESFTSFVPRLQDIPVLLQTGKDLQVLETINGFSVDLQKLYQLLPLISITGLKPEDTSIEGVLLETFPTELAPVLAELLSAMENKDTVLVGDLSEYELAPRIAKLGARLSSL